MFKVKCITSHVFDICIISIGSLSLFLTLYRLETPKRVLLTGPEVIKLFSCSTQLSTKFQLLTKIKYRQMMIFLALSLSDVVFVMLINVKMPTIVGILTFMSSIDFVEMEKVL